MARISLPATSSPCASRYSPSAPATQLSSTSLIEQFSALPTALTSSSGIGWHHATFLMPLGVPLSRVFESSGISASAAESWSTWSSTLAMFIDPLKPLSRLCSTDFLGSPSKPSERAAPSPMAPSALTVSWVNGLRSVSSNHSSAPWGEAFLRLRSGGAEPPSTSDMVTEISAMPSPMQWWMRTISALPLTPSGPV